MTKVLFVQSFVDLNELHLKLHNRAFNYGDGVFETLVCEAGKVRYFDDHYERLLAAAQAFSLDLPSYFNPSFLQDGIQKLLIENELPVLARVKIQLWRKGSGLFLPEKNETETLITSSAFSPAPALKAKLGIYRAIKKDSSSISAFKTLSSALYVLASIERKRLGLDDMVILSSQGTISECNSSNLFYIKDHVLYTPNLQSACIDGIMRKQILNTCKLLNIDCVEKEVTEQELQNADVVFTANVTGLSIVQQIESTQYATEHPIIEQLRVSLHL